MCHINALEQCEINPTYTGAVKNKKGALESIKSLAADERERASVFITTFEIKV